MQMFPSCRPAASGQQQCFWLNKVCSAASTAAADLLPTPPTASCCGRPGSAMGLQLQEQAPCTPALPNYRSSEQDLITQTSLDAFIINIYSTYNSKIHSCTKT